MLSFVEVRSFDALIGCKFKHTLPARLLRAKLLEYSSVLRFIEVRAHIRVHSV